ncbi:DUF4493 domain-containing protein [uncultured Phocaeicola sp.]|uniref:DUF4493 domain-containing protein n=1 Tax=uncultured Phocaeicola sp. TaxID=990718 RepID=UPI0025D8BAD8|nr:DUF4493 domain-containing protein [uncultured Phocaeicola sp.]
MKYIKVFYTGLIGLLLAACTNELQVSDYGQGEGRLVLSEIQVETVVGDVITRASLDAEILPEASDFTIEIIDSEGALVKTLEPGTLQCILSAGTYTLKATYGDAAVMSATPAFYGESNVTITEGEITTTSITASLKQAVIHPRISEELIVHLEEYSLTIRQPEGLAVEMSNDKDFFVPAGETYTLTLSGINQLGESFSHNWQYESLALRTRYTVECNPDLPSFTMPEQSEGNVWSKFIYITPMTVDNMTSHQEMADKVLGNIVYEASSDGTTWIPSEKTEDGKIVIKGLEASTTYTLRSRFGSVYSDNTFEVTTESAQQVENGDMESWNSTKLHSGNGTWDKDLYCDYCSNWATRNERTTLGAEDANSGGIFGLLRGAGYGVSWRWCSGTISTDDKTEKSKAAEISTLAFYNDRVSGIWGRDNIYNEILNNGTTYVGYLFLGSFDKNSDSYTLGIDHKSRPVSISFDYKYAPMPTSDQCIAYAKVYDSEHQEIASTPTFNSQEQVDYKTEVLTFTYTSLTKNASYISVFFQSGTNTDIANMKQIEGSYGASPFNQDRVVGSVLKIDNVTLNYDYE